MELALIPPISLLKDTHLSKMQLMLPQLLDGLGEEPIYDQVYYGHCQNPDQYVILDNGAAEANRVTSQQLLNIASLYKPDEVAIPDSLANGEETIELAEAFFADHDTDIKQINHVREASLKFGLVTQGKSANDALYTVYYASLQPWFHHVKVLYLPRLLIAESGNIHERIELLIKLQAIYGDRFEYHFFGAAPLWPAEMFAASKFNFLRSMDTSLPYSLSYWDVGPHAMYPEVKRPEDYFNLPSDEFSYPSEYVDVFLNWSKGISHGSNINI